MDNKQKKQTIYQGLNDMLNLDGRGFDNQHNTISAPTQEKTKVIIKGNTPEEIQRKGLELQQKKELQNKFFRTSDRGFQKALQYEAARLPAYIDYEGMEYYPIISSALDLFMEETTTIGVNGKMLNIYSNKERIKSELDSFFYDIVNVNVNLPFWARNLVKYGDNFVLLYGERKSGITHVKQMVNYEIERFERIQNGKPVIKFKERMTGDEFNTFEVAHFRLLGDDKYLPYGSSVLNKIRRVFRQLVMAEDAMLTYRIIRAGEKKVFKIDVGNIDEDDIEDYIYKVATKFKKSSQITPTDGQIDYRFNILGNDEDYFLPVRNANTVTGIETLPGASNLDQIADIEYLRDNLFAGLGIPKPFLSFQDAAGGGKNMAQFDIRLAKKVNRIQQALIQELNKMAMIHLYLLGYSGDDINDFTLTLTNPSTQEDLLKSDLLREQAQTYTELTRGENGIAAMSHTRAKRLVFNMSDAEIVVDLKQQKMEKSIMQELQDSPTVIKNTGLFKDIDDRYGEPIDGMALPQATGDTEQGGMPPIGGDMPMDDSGGVPPTPSGGMPPLSEMTFNELIDNVVYNNSNKSKNRKNTNNKIIISENNNINDKLNNSAKNMINEIDLLLENNQSFNNDNRDDDIDDIDFEAIGDLDLDV